MDFNFAKSDKLLSSYERARFVALITCFSAFLYHVAIFIFFGIFQIYPMFVFNIFSISLFACLLFLIPKNRSYTFMYFLASIEVTVHQVLAEYFLGSNTNFHFFILLMGLLPFLIFEDKFKKSVPFTVTTSVVYIIVGNIHFPPIYGIPSFVEKVLSCTNISVSISILIIIVLIYTYIVFAIERQMKRHNNNLENEIRLAAFIQQNFYKHEKLNINNYDIAYYNRPMAGVSGDLYDFYENNGVVEGFGIFDVSGHGISAGLVTMLVKNIIQQEYSRNKDLELWEIVNIINDRVINEKGKIQNYLTGILGRINNNKLEIVNAGHPYPIIYRRETGSCECMEKAADFAGGAIGISGFPAYYYSQIIELKNGDEIFLYTDGISDTVNKFNERFGSKCLFDIIRESAHLPASEQIRIIRTRLKEFRNDSEINDDMTMIVIKRDVILDV